MSAPEEFAAWLASNRHEDKKLGRAYNYHPRSDAHSVALCEFVARDLREASPSIHQQMDDGRVAFGINVAHTWPSGKKKTLDLALGLPAGKMRDDRSQLGLRLASALSTVLFSCEAKTTMTEHVKSKPRIFDELSSSHEIVHQADPTAIAAGITVVNIAESFVSPLRQRPSTPLQVTPHRQPHVTEAMVNHLRGLARRSDSESPGFDAYCTVVISCDNQRTARLWTAPPAPQTGDQDHYDTFILEIVNAFERRFA